MIRDYKSAQQYLQTSCHTVEKLTFRGKFYTAAQIDAISQSIGQFCSHTLLELDLHEAGNVLLTSTTIKFPQTRQLRLDYTNLPANLQIHRIFPVLQTLSIIAFYEPNANGSPLIHLAAVLPRMPQLRGFVVVSPANTILHVIQDALPNLESLAIIYDESVPVNGTVHFPNVKHFTLTTMSLSARQSGQRSFPITFNHLETLDLFPYDGTFDYTMADWIEQNIELKKVSSAFVFGETESIRFISSLSRLPNLEHVTMDVSGDTSIAYELQHLENVRMVTFTMVALFKYTQDQLLETVPSGWHAVDGGWKDIDGGSGALTVVRQVV